MTDTAPREVLLVGEGNFSFSAALCQAAAGNAKVTATCFQAEDVAHQQACAAENIQRLRECGAEVCYQVDCTRLGECTSLKHRLFDCIIFNFPHCGRKSGVKKNRSLLAKFFFSCIQVLQKSGEVHVALCNGQGGTPMDKPMRDWHNSWQAVAMAAEAGLILSQICPFSQEKYLGYKCTGYRSQDKGFHVEGALNHIFTRSLPLPELQSACMTASLGKETFLYELPGELSEFANRHFLGPQSHHPVQLVLDQVLKSLKTDWCVQTPETDFPQLFRYSPDRLATCDSTVSSCEIYRIRKVSNVNAPEGAEKEPYRNGEGGFALRPSMMVHLQEILQHVDFRTETLYAYTGVVYRRVPVCSSPAFHQLLLVGEFPQGSQSIRTLKSNLEATPALHGISFIEEEEGQVYGLRVNSESGTKIGSLGVLAATGDRPKGLGLCAATFNLDLLAAQLFCIPDWRLLWSPDPRFLSHFIPESPGPFCQFSLYPPAYIHDVSFWVEPDSFDELDFHALVRQVSLCAVRKVALVDRFRHPHMGHASLCYRLTYQSPDRALSHSRALGMQLQLRRQLPSHLDVTLR